MSFSSITMLWLIWVLPALFLISLWGHRKRRRILSEYASEKGRSAITPSISQLRRWLKTTLLLAVALLLVFSLAGPQYGYSWKKIDRKGVDLIIALDCSRSMLATDIQPSRLERAKREVLDLLGMIQGDRVGLVAFAGTAFLQCPLTLDYEGFHLFLDALGPDFLPVGGTNLAAAIGTALSAFEAEDATDKAIILITDGEATGENPLPTAKEAAAAGVKIFAIGIGAPDGAPVPSADGGYVKDSDGNIVLSKLDEAALKQMAAVSSGAYVRSVAGDMDLDVLYQRHIRGTMEAGDLGEQKTKVFENRYQWALGLALCFFILEFLLTEKKTPLLLLLLLVAAAAPRTASASQLKDALEQGQSAYTSGDFDAAVQHYVTAQLEEPEKAEIFYNLGNARYKSGDYDGALQAYGQVLGSDDVTLKEKAQYNMGNTYYRKGDLDKAIESYEAALSMDKSDAQAQENLDFVKKLKENPPQDSSQGQERQQDSDQNKDKENPQAGNQDDKSQAQQDPDNKDRQSQEQQGQNQQESSGDPQSQEDKKENDKAASDQEQPSEGQQQGSSQDASSGEASDTTSPDEESLRQAEKMLNRLQDQPGRAMIPAYRERNVEKDW